MNKFKKVVSLSAVLGAVPFFAFAVDADSILYTINRILNIVIPLLITIAVVYFIWGVIQYTISQDEEAKKGARSKIIQGIIGLFIILAFWALVDVIGSTFGLQNTQLDQTKIPCIPNPGLGITC